MPAIYTREAHVQEPPAAPKVDDSAKHVKYTLPATTPSSTNTPRLVVSISRESTTLASDRVLKDYTVTEEGFADSAENPQQKAAVNSLSQTAGCSDIVRPLARLVPKITDIWWLVDIYDILKSILDPDSGFKNRHNTIVSRVNERIDLNELLPSSEEDFSQWQTYAGARNS